MFTDLKQRIKEIRLARDLNSAVKGIAFDFVYQLNKLRFDDYSNQIKPSDFDQIARKLLQERGAKLSNRTINVNDLNIFFIGTYFDHETQGFFQGLQRLGRVHTYINLWGGYGINPPGDLQPSEQELAKSRQHLYESVLDVHRNKPIDFIIGTLTAPRISLDVLHAIRALGIRIVNYAQDDMLIHQWEKRNEVQMGAFGLGPAVDLSLQTTPALIPRYLKSGFPAIYFPFASDSTIFHPESEKNIDVLFIGNCYGKRERLVSKLLAADIQVQAFGLGFPNGHIAGEHVPRLFSRSKIILGTGFVGHSGKLMTLKLRDFDAPMSGALYLTTNNLELANHFDIGTEILTYTDVNDCIRIIKYYLKNEDERARIAIDGRARAIDEHTWNHRMVDLLRIMRLS